MNVPPDSLFRRSAIEHYLTADEGGEVIRVSPPWTWAVFALIATAVAAALFLSVFARIEIADVGVGILRPTSGVRTLVAQTSGVVTYVGATSGDHVPQDGIVIRIDSAELQANLLEADRAVRALSSDAAAHLEQQRRKLDEQEASLRRRLTILQQVIASQEESVHTYERRLQRSADMLKSGLLSAAATDDARESLAQSRRTLGATRQNLEQTRQEVSELESRRQNEDWQSQYNVQNAQSKRDSAALLLQRTEIRAPVAGGIEAMKLKVGDVVQAGQPIARVVPRDVELQVVSFLPEKDRPFVKVGDVVKLEIEKSADTEIKSLSGQIVRIGDDIASSQETREVMGDDVKLGSLTFPVVIVFPITGLAGAHHPHLRSGMLLTVRYTLRRERPIVLFFAPLRRWLNT